MRNGRIAAAALLLAGCSTLETSPGADLEVQVQTRSIDATGRQAVSVELRIAGCAAPGAEVSANGIKRSVALEKTGPVSYRATVPTAWLEETAAAASCMPGAEPRSTSGGWRWYGVDKTVEVKVEVTCQEAGQVRLGWGWVDVVFAARFVPWWLYPYPRTNLGDLLFTGDVGENAPEDPIWPYSVTVLGNAAAEVWQVGNGGGGDDLRGTFPIEVDLAAWSADPLLWPRLAVRGTDFWMSAGCRDRALCPPVPVPEAPGLAVPSEALVGNTAWTEPPHVVHVPTRVIDLAFDDATLVVLSRASGEGPEGGTFLTRVNPASGAVTVTAHLPGVQALTRFSRAPNGARAFLARVGEGELALYRADGEGGLMRGAESIHGEVEGLPSLSPDGSTVLVWLRDADGVGARPWLGPPGALEPLDALATEAPPTVEGRSDGVAWGDGSVAVWNGWKLPTQEPRVAAFALAPPHAPLFEATFTGALDPLGVLGLGDRFVVTTQSGVQVLDLHGDAVIDVDPLPCGLYPTAPAVVAGPGRGGRVAAVQAGAYVLVFDLNPVSP